MEATIGQWNKHGSGLVNCRPGITQTGERVNINVLRKFKWLKTIEKKQKNKI